VEQMAGRGGMILGAGLVSEGGRFVCFRLEMWSF